MGDAETDGPAAVEPDAAAPTKRRRNVWAIVALAVVILAGALTAAWLLRPPATEAAPAPSSTGSAGMTAKTLICGRVVTSYDAVFAADPVGVGVGAVSYTHLTLPTILLV